MLKVPLVEEEAVGGRLLAAWNGSGASATVFEVDDQAIVLDRAPTGRDLAALTRSGEDRAAVVILCSVMRSLHAAIPIDDPEFDPIGGLPSLDHWFRELLRFDTSGRNGAPGDPASAAFIARGRLTAMRLLAATTARDTVVLHGDLHHMNVLEFASDEWRAIDPKGIVGHRGFEVGALFDNPDARSATDDVLLVQRVEVVADRLDLLPGQVLDWVVARSALSAVWSLQDGERSAAEVTIAVGLLAERHRADLPPDLSAGA